LSVAPLKVDSEDDEPGRKTNSKRAKKSAKKRSPEADSKVHHFQKEIRRKK
jgi:hypothetical protein